MAFRHYEGTVKPVNTTWVCPTCGASNTGRLEEGCPRCKAGADAKAGAPADMIQRVIQLPSTQLRSPFDAWMLQTFPRGLDTAGWSIASAAWDAGYAGGFAAGQGLAKEPSVEKAMQQIAQQGGWMLQMTHSDPATWGDPEHMATPLDTRQHATLLAALAFYRDNQLAYGVLPGQLSAEEVTDLITKLSPSEEAPQ